jgi:hypothetical protein
MYEMLVADVRVGLEKLAADFEPARLDGPGAVAFLGELGVVRRLCDGLIARTASRVEETKACERGGDRDAARACLMVCVRGRVVNRLEHTDGYDEVRSGA